MPTTLLAVDDSVTMRKVLEMTFAGEDFRVVTADSADAGWPSCGPSVRASFSVTSPWTAPVATALRQDQAESPTVAVLAHGLETAALRHSQRARRSRRRLHREAVRHPAAHRQGETPRRPAPPKQRRRRVPQLPPRRRCPSVPQRSQAWLRSVVVRDVRRPHPRRRPARPAVRLLRRKIVRRCPAWPQASVAARSLTARTRCKTPEPPRRRRKRRPHRLKQPLLRLVITVPRDSPRRLLQRPHRRSRLPRPRPPRRSTRLRRTVRRLEWWHPSAPWEPLLRQRPSRRAHRMDSLPPSSSTSGSTTRKFRPCSRFLAKSSRRSSGKSCPCSPKR